MKVYTVAARGNPGTVRLLKRGNAMDEGEVFIPGLSPRSLTEQRLWHPAERPDSERRKQLAYWLTDPENPLLTA
ncbi:MAG: hypothetical protein Ct9H300mP32_5900 [Verrucomicrobiota bacterium]|nr:MAG: hypothetical protein Ct9H300mP32_5900 [Verrucomicrobiota bacterium]